MKIYTKSGDAGETSLFGGRRVYKDDTRLEAYGTIDELNAVLGVAQSTAKDLLTKEIIKWLQNTLFIAGGELASPDTVARSGASNSSVVTDTIQQPETAKPQFQIPVILEKHSQQAETYIDKMQAELPELREFILPGGTAAAAHLHAARTICRRAERVIITLTKTEQVSKNLVIFVNRLSDLLFILARWENYQSGEQDVKWEK
ncbi:MAG: cob(I)yrinic acid a,c-diamide adenosyltransferase [Ignavibacteriales bacterium]|nr:cob(I)yrinic acid a,c-diamide adenosyltransferase [Ignavibacteriales bacterium]